MLKVITKKYFIFQLEIHKFQGGFYRITSQPRSYRCDRDSKVVSWWFLRKIFEFIHLFIVNVQTNDWLLWKSQIWEKKIIKHIPWMKQLKTSGEESAMCDTESEYKFDSHWPSSSVVFIWIFYSCTNLCYLAEFRLILIKRKIWMPN